MRNVTPQFRALGLLSLLTWASPAQEAMPKIEGGGALKVAGRRLTFKPSEAVAGPPQGAVRVKVLRLKGTFRSPSGEPLDLEMQFTETGMIYRMNLFRKAGDQEVERWAATLKTQVKVLELDGRVGGIVRLRLSGPLSGMVAGVGRQDAWEGDLWFTLQSWPER